MDVSGAFSVGGHDDPHHNFVVYAPMITKFGKDMEPEVFYTKVRKYCDVINIT